MCVTTIEANFADGVRDDLLPGSEQSPEVERTAKRCAELVPGHSCIRHIVPGLGRDYERNELRESHIPLL